MRKHHALTNAEALKRFMDCPRIKVAEHETASLVKLEMEIEEKYLLYERKALVSTGTRTANILSHILLLDDITCKRGN